jgi:signal transduction histidine kinase
MAAIALVVLVAAAYVASATAHRAVDENEHRLLLDRTAEIQSLLESLGSGYEVQVASISAIAEVTNGDPDLFREAVLSFDEGAAEATDSGWGLLRRTPAGFEQLGLLGTATPAADFPPEFTDGLLHAAEGNFTVLGFRGSGLTRSLIMASGRPGAGGEYVTYSEFGLLDATAASASGGGVSEDDNPISGVAIEVFIGTKADPDQLLFAFGTADESNEVRRVVEIAGAEVFIEVSPTGPLGGSLAVALPNFLLIGGILLGLSLSGVLEITQRRRDDAVGAVKDLEQQNELLDAALHEQQVAEAARAALEVELRQAQRLEAIGHLAGGVAHDFNNVLAAILSYADLASDGVTDPQVQADLESIQHAARRGADLTRKLLQFSRRKAGEVSLVDVNERVADVAGMLGRTLGEDVTLRTALGADPATTLIDPVELDQVLLNLVVNARDAVPPGGSIVISTELAAFDADDDARPVDADVGTYVRLAVTDDGCGMNADVIEHAFDPFFTTKGRGEGTGLGLSTVYGIVQRFGGHVDVTSTPGEGTTIEVLLPSSTEPPDATEGAADHRSVAVGHGRTVLVVEDEEPLRRALHRMLERAGFTVLEAPDGRSAIDGHRDGQVDLLLTDVVMPKGVTGVDVAAAFRDRDATLPVVYMTGYSDDILGPDQLDGNTVLLPKPFSEAELVDAVGAALGAHA